MSTESAQEMQKGQEPVASSCASLRLTGQPRRLSHIKLERPCRPLPHLPYSDTSISHPQLLAVSQGWLMD